MADNTGFYSRFFRKRTFLAAGVDLTGVAHFGSWGFPPTLTFNGGTVLELGAGRGRLTTYLQQCGALATAGRYIVVEPSDGLDHIRQTVRGPNVVFHRAELRQLADFIAPGSVDYFIASGVIPHIDRPTLANTIADIARYVRPGGILHIVSSYYGFPKTAAFALNRWCVGHPLGGRIAALATTILQGACCAGPSDRLRELYIRNFIYSFQSRFAGKYDQMREFYAIRPYNIRYGYPDYFAALRSAGFAVDRLFPYSLALTARKATDASVRFEPLPAGARVAVLGDDWSGRYVKRSLEARYGYRIEMFRTPAELPACDAVVVAYDYTRASPYHAVVKELEARGFTLGTTLFLFQMLL